MTILTGEAYRVMTLSQFMDRLGYDGYSELILAMEKEHQQTLVEAHNESGDHTQVDSVQELVAELPEATLQDAVTADFADYEVIKSVLEADNREWIHLFADELHTIVKIHPDQPT